MGFTFSKMIWFLVDPTTSLLLLAVAGIALSGLGRGRLGKPLTVLPLLLLIVGGFLPVGYWLLVPLQERFPPTPTSLSDVDGIIVLGGALNPSTTKRWGQAQINLAGDRIVAMVDLMHRFPEARVIYSGGSGSVTHDDLREADFIPDLLERFGMDPRRVTYERESRNTHENATYAHSLAKPREAERWVLVTSAFHMPRSIGAFRAVGWDPVPYPVDYQNAEITEFPFRASKRMHLLAMATTEWVGLVAYRLLGRSKDLFPAPARPKAAAR